jgi:glucans biosynthesis protein C
MSNSTRLHGLDVLRGVAMTLGVFLHGAIAYKVGYHSGNWVFDHEFDSYFFDWLYLWINSFRMQLFFLLAGFFARLLIHKIGVQAFAKNRFKRIVIPLALAYFTILPLTLVPYLYSEFQAAGQEPWSHLRDFFAAFFTLRITYGLMHLWFLQHLIVFCVLAIAGVWLATHSRWVQGLGKWGKGVFRQRVSTVMIIVLATTAMVGGITMLFNAPLPTIWVGMVIPVPQFLYYFFFFSLGFLLEDHRELFVSFNRVYKPFLAAGTVLSFVTVYLVNVYGATAAVTSLPVVLLKFTFALQTVLLVVGFIGMFNAVFREPSAFWKYIADSAYWVYLLHMPVVMATQLLLRGSAVPGVLRFPAVIIVTLTICFTTYHYLVRYTWVGVLLNGKRS